MNNIDAIIGLDQLSIPVPAAWDVARVNLTMQLNRLSEPYCHILQVLVDLKWFHYRKHKMKFRKLLHSKRHEKRQNKTLPTVNLYMALSSATCGHDRVRPSIFSGCIINYQVVFITLTLNPVPGAHSCWNLNTVLHPDNKSISVIGIALVVCL